MSMLPVGVTPMIFLFTYGVSKPAPGFMQDSSTEFVMVIDSTVFLAGLVPFRPFTGQDAVRRMGIEIRTLPPKLPASTEIDREQTA